MKTLEDLGYEKTHEFVESVRYAKKDNSYLDYFHLGKDEKVSFGVNANVSQELFKAIEHEMKKRGLWK